jgi:hypothetical protein
MLSELSPSEKIRLQTFAEETAELIKKAIRTKDVTGYGASNASEKLVNSVEIEYHETGFRILANHYIYYLIYGRKPGRFPNITAIKDWIVDRGIKTELPINSLAFLIARKISEEGNSVWQKFHGADSGLLSDALSDSRINAFFDGLGEDITSRIRSEIYIQFNS